MSIQLNDTIILAAIMLTESRNQTEQNQGRFQLAIANSSGITNYDLQQVIETLAKERFAKDIEKGKIRVNRDEGRTEVSWKDYANQISEASVPATYASRPHWYSWD